MASPVLSGPQVQIHQPSSYAVLVLEKHTDTSGVQVVSEAQASSSAPNAAVSSTVSNGTLRQPCAESNNSQDQHTHVSPSSSHTLQRLFCLPTVAQEATGTANTVPSSITNTPHPTYFADGDDTNNTVALFHETTAPAQPSVSWIEGGTAVVDGQPAPVLATAAPTQAFSELLDTTIVGYLNGHPGCLAPVTLPAATATAQAAAGGALCATAFDSPAEADATVAAGNSSCGLLKAAGIDDDDKLNSLLPQPTQPGTGCISSCLSDNCGPYVVADGPEVQPWLPSRHSCTSTTAADANLQQPHGMPATWAAAAEAALAHTVPEPAATHCPTFLHTAVHPPAETQTDSVLETAVPPTATAQLPGLLSPFVAGESACCTTKPTTAACDIKTVVNPEAAAQLFKPSLPATATSAQCTAQDAAQLPLAKKRKARRSKSANVDSQLQEAAIAVAEAPNSKKQRRASSKTTRAKRTESAPAAVEPVQVAETTAQQPRKPFTTTGRLLGLLRPVAPPAELAVHKERAKRGRKRSPKVVHAANGTPPPGDDIGALRNAAENGRAANTMKPDPDRAVPGISITSTVTIANCLAAGSAPATACPNKAGNGCSTAAEAPNPDTASKPWAVNSIWLRVSGPSGLGHEACQSFSRKRMLEQRSVGEQLVKKESSAAFLDPSSQRRVACQQRVMKPMLGVYKRPTVASKAVMSAAAGDSGIGHNAKAEVRKRAAVDSEASYRELCEALDQWRTRRAAALGRKPSCLLPDAHLCDLAYFKPSSFLQLQQTVSLGAQWLQSYGHEVIDVIRNFLHGYSKRARLHSGTTTSDNGSGLKAPEQQACIDAVDCAGMGSGSSHGGLTDSDGSDADFDVNLLFHGSSDTDSSRELPKQGTGLKVLDPVDADVFFQDKRTANEALGCSYAVANGTQSGALTAPLTANPCSVRVFSTGAALRLQILCGRVQDATYLAGGLVASSGKANSSCQPEADATVHLDSAAAPVTDMLQPATAAAAATTLSVETIAPGSATIASGNLSAMLASPACQQGAAGAPTVGSGSCYVRPRSEGVLSAAVTERVSVAAAALAATPTQPAQAGAVGAAAVPDFAAPPLGGADAAGSFMPVLPTAAATAQSPSHISLGVQQPPTADGRTAIQQATPTDSNVSESDPTSTAAEAIADAMFAQSRPQPPFVDRASYGSLQRDRKPYLAVEDEWLLEQLAAGRKVRELSRCLQRPEGGVRQRVKKLRTTLPEGSVPPRYRADAEVFGRVQQSVHQRLGLRVHVPVSSSATAASSPTSPATAAATPDTPAATASTSPTATATATVLAGAPSASASVPTGGLGSAGVGKKAGRCRAPRLLKPRKGKLLAYAKTPDFRRHNRAQLQRFLLEAGLGSEAFPQPDASKSTLVQLAQTHLPAWEVHRVLACMVFEDSVVQRAEVVLRVCVGVGADAMRAAFRKLSLVLHPDKNSHPKAADAFQIVREAYEVLTKPVW